MTSAMRLTVFVLVAAVGIPPAMETEAGARSRVVSGERKAGRSRSHAVGRKKKDVAEKRLRRARRHRTARRIGRRPASVVAVVPASFAAPASATTPPSVSSIPMPPEPPPTALKVNPERAETAEQQLEAIERRLAAMDTAVAHARARTDDLKASVLQPKAGERARGGPGSVSAPSI